MESATFGRAPVTHPHAKGPPFLGRYTLPVPIPLPESPRLRYAPLVLDDAEFLVELLTDADFLRYIGDRGVHSVADVGRYLAEGPWASYTTNGFGLLALRETASGAPVGIAGLLKRPSLADVDLGYALLPAFRGRGYAREAGAALLALAAAAFGLRRVIAIVTPDNAASIRTLTALGFRAEGRLRVGAADEVDCYALALG